jgi:hypothetical protein
MKPRSFGARIGGVAVLIVLLTTCAVVMSSGGLASAQDGGERVLDLGKAIEQRGVDACCDTMSGEVSWWQFFQRTDLLGSDGHSMPVDLEVDRITFPLRFDFEAGTVTGELEWYAAHSERDEEFEGTLSGRVVNGSVTQPYGETWVIDGTILMDITVSGWRKDWDKDKQQVLLEATRSSQFEAELDGELAYDYEGEPVQLDDGGYYYPVVEEPNYEISIFFSESDEVTEGLFISWECDYPHSSCTLPAGFLPPLSEEPEFNVSLGCQPTTPAARESVVCTVKIDGVQYGETFEYHWYLDNASVGSTADPSWTWDEAQPGTHDVGVQVVGEGRWADADFTLTVGEAEDLVVTIGMMPDPPLEGKSILLSAHVEGQFPKEELFYNWFLNGDLMCETESCSLDPLEGSHTVQLDVYGSGDRIATDIRTFTVAPAADAVADAGDAAGFAITDLSCSDGISSDETLACTAQFERLQGGIGSLNVIWVIDGVTASSASTDGDSASWSLDQPAPGTHDVDVQVIDPATDMARVRGTEVEVRAGRNAMIPPIMQVGAAGGTLVTIGAWTWWEWLRQRREAALRQDRQGWFDRVGELNRADREQRQLREAEQRAMEKEYKKLFGGLMKASERSEGLDALLDFVERHRDDVCRDGVWDRWALDRLQESVRRLGMRQFDRDQYRARLDFSRAMPPGLDALCELSKNIWVRVGSDILLSGVSEIFWTPVSALDKMWEAVRAGKSADAAAWEGYKGAAKDMATMVVWDRLFTGIGKAFAPELERAGEWAAQRARWVADKVAGATPDGVRRVARWGWDTANTSIEDSARNLLNRFRRPSLADQMDQLRRLNPKLCDDMENLLRRADDGLDLQSVDMIQRRGPGGKMEQVILTADEEIALKLLNNPRYREALDQGLVPRHVHGAVNHVRDKLAKKAIANAFDSLGHGARQRIRRIEFTGTGARPRSSAALSGWTDLDMTVRGHLTEGELYTIEKALESGDDVLAGQIRAKGLHRVQEAEEAFAEAFRRELKGAGIADAGNADVNMFSGLHARPDAPPPGGYASREMIHWQETDVTFRARCAVPTERGSIMFNAHPDVRPMPGQAPRVDLNLSLGHPERAGFSVDQAAADARRLIGGHLEEMPGHIGRPPTRLDILRAEGKHARRVWWVENAGSGEQAPAWMQTLDRAKSDRTWVPSQQELDEAWEGFVNYLGLSDQLGGIQ